MVATGQGKVREKIFFQGQGIIREYFNMPGKNMLAKCQEKVREFRRKFKLVLENSHKVFVHAIQIELF